MKFEELKDLFIKILIGSLIAAAAIAVIAVLIGSFSDILGKALATLALVIIHALASLLYIGQTQKHDGEDEFKILNNAIFTIIILSFFTSIFGVWELLPGEIVAKLYGTYLIALFACIHAEMLVRTLKKTQTIDSVVYGNFVFMGVVILLLLPLLWMPDVEFGDFYFRVLAAAAIIDATLTILSVILHRLYLQKHPEEQSTLFKIADSQVDQNGNVVSVHVQQESKRGIHPIIWLLIIYVAAQVLIPILLIASAALKQ